jgi:hypothetical protein
VHGESAEPVTEQAQGPGRGQVVRPGPFAEAARRQTIEAAAAWGFRALALEVQRRDRCLHFKCKAHRLATGASWRNSKEILRIAWSRARGTGPALPRDRTHATRDSIPTATGRRCDIFRGARFSRIAKHNWRIEMSVSWFRPLGFMAALVWFAAGCSSEKKIEAGGACIMNSDCTQPLVCTEGKCHDACHTSVDCPAGQSCMNTDGVAICQLPDEAVCSQSCGGTLVCASDQHCRTPCQSRTACTSEQVCVSGVCAAPSRTRPQRPASAERLWPGGRWRREWMPGGTGRVLLVDLHRPRRDGDLGHSTDHERRTPLPHSRPATEVGSNDAPRSPAERAWI